jgi:hypothetical protein
LLVLVEELNGGMEGWKVGGVAQVVKCLPSKYEALSSNPITAKTNQTKKPQNTELKQSSFGGFDFLVVSQ